MKDDFLDNLTLDNTRFGDSATDQGRPAAADDVVDDPMSAVGGVAQEAGIDPRFLTGLAKLETRLGDATIRGGGTDTRNLFNIKDFSGGGIRALDKAEGSRDAYRAYGSYRDSARDLVDLLKRKYPAALNAQTPEEFARALKAGGYATDPNYESKLARVIASQGGARPAPKPPTQPLQRQSTGDDFLSSLSYEKWAKESGQADQRLIDADLPEPVKDRTGGQMAGDLALSLAQGGVGAVRSLTDLAGADNKVSALLDDASKGVQSAKSEYAQQVAAASQQRIEDAKGQGTMAEVSAYLDAIWDAPLDMTAQAAGSLLPFLFTGGAAAGARVLGIANAAKKAGVAKDVFLKSPAGQMAAKEIAKTVGSITSKANIGMGVGMGLGGVKGQQYETTLKEAKAKGLSDEEAKKLATEAQAYGGSAGGTLQQLGGAALGGIGAATGPLERALSRIPSAAQPGRGIIGRTLVGGLKEALPEGAQGAQQAWAGNEAAVGAGVMDSSRRFEGVVGQGAQEAVLSFPMGGVAGAMESGPAQQKANAPAASGTSAPPPTTPAAPVTPAGTPPQQPAAPTAQGAQPASAAAQPAAIANIATMADADLNALIEAIDATDDDAVTDDQWERYALAITEANRRAAATPPAATTAPTAPAENAAAPAPLPTYMPGIEINSNRERPKQAKVLQPRQRDSAASVNQMLTNAKNLDWLQVSQSPVLGVGAPVVFGDLPQRALVGAEQPVTDMAGNTIRTRYAIVDASDVIASNAIDGSPVREYETGAPGKLRAIAGNGRKEAINHAYALGVAQEKYLPNLLQEANKFGIEVQPQALEAMQRPMLVRIMDEGDVTDNFGAVTNARIGLDRSDVEQAADDARDFDFGQAAFDERGAPTEDSIAKFIQSLPSNEAGNLATNDGRISAQAERRFMAATFKRAYEDDALVQEVTMETDPDAKRVLDAAMNASGVMAALKGRGEFDLAPAVADAMKIAINAARKKTKLADEAENQDIAISDEGRMVARFLAKPEVNGSSQRMAAALRQWGKKALTQAEIQAAEREGGQGNLLGEPTPTMSRKQLFDELQVADGSVDQSIGEQPGGAAIRAIPAADKNPSQEDSPAADQPQQGDILNNVGEPFKSPKAAEIKAKKDNQGGQVTPVRGGYVVRVPQNMATSATATMGARGQTLTAGPGFTAADVVRRDPIAGQKINDEWTAFSSQSGTLGIPRAQMPQVKATDRGAMVNFLKARGIDSSKEQLPPTALKPTQAEFSPAKVQQAADRTDGDRSIIVSADGYVVDGHHQWLAQRQKGQPVNVIRLDQPIAQVLEALKEMPSAQPERVDAESAQPPSSDLEQNQAVAPANPAQAATENVAVRSAKDEIPGESSALAAKQRWEQAKADEVQQAERDKLESDKYNAYVREQEFQAERRRLQGDRTIRQANGKPFKTAAGAQALLDKFDLGESHVVQQDGSGFALRDRYDVRESYMQARDAVLAEMGITGETADGDIDAAEAQWDEIHRRVDQRLKQMLPAPNPNPKPNQPTAQSQQAQAATENVAPEVGPFGPILTQYYHDAQGAIKALTALQDGEAVAALHYPGVGDIDLVWGKEGTQAKDYEDGMGLAKIIKKHSEVLDDLQGFVSSLSIQKRSKNRVILSSRSGRALIRLDWDGKAKHWLLTAYDDEKKASVANEGRTGVSVGADSAPPAEQVTEAGQSVPPTDATAQPRPKGWEKNYGTAKQVAESIGIELRGANGKMKKTPELVAEIKAADSTPKQAGASAPEQQKLPPTDIRIGDKVVVDGEAYTVTGPLKDGKKVVGVVASKDSDTNPLYGVREVFLRGDEAIVARIAAQQSLLQSGDQSLLLDTAQEEAATTPAQSKPVSLEDGATKAPEQDKETQGIGRRIAETEKRLEALRKNQSESGSNAWVWDKKIEDAERTLAAYKQAKQSIEGRAPAASSPTQAAQDNGKTPVPASQQDSKGPYATWRDSTFAQRRELLRAAGYTDADQGRVLSGMDWSNLTDPVRNALSAPAKAPAKPEGASAAKPLMQAAQESGKLPMATVGDKKPASKLDAAAALDAPPKPEPKPSTNTVFTEDAAEKARARLKAKLGRLNSGIDPEMLMDGITLAGYHIEKGARTFAAYAKAMMDDLGDGVKPYLKSWYMGAKYDPRAAGFDGMSTAAEVEGADIDQIARESVERPIADADTGAASPQPAEAPALKDIFAGLESSGLPKSAAADAAKAHPQADLIEQVNSQFHDLLLDLMETQGVLEVNGYNTETEENKPCL